MLTIQKSLEKILFIIPKHSTKETEKISKGTVVAPFGVLSIVSYLEQYCPEVEFKIIDFNPIQDFDTHKEILLQTIQDFTPDCVGLSLMYSISLKDVCSFADLIKSYNSDIFIVAGGVHASNIPQDVFRKTNSIDAISHGEGEIPFKDLILSTDKQKTLKNHQAWLLPEDYKEGKRAKPVFVENLDDIPPINFSHVDISVYSSRLGKMFGNNQPITLPIHSTRGCPYNCVFCCAGTNHGKKIRYMSPDRFLDDVARMIDQYNLTKIQIDDDQFLFNKKRALKILEGLSKLDIDIEMPSGLSVKFIDEEVAELLQKAGLKVVTLAIESGSPNVLKNVMKKPLNVEQVEPAAAALKKYNLLIHTFFMFGLPYEFDRDREMSRNMMLEIGFDWNYVFLAAPFKGSRLYEICQENNFLSEQDPSQFTVYTSAIKAPGVDPETIEKYVYLLNLDINFVHNHNMKIKNYERAAGYFRSVAERYPFHAFANFYLAESLRKLGIQNDEWENAQKNYNSIINKDSKWQDNATLFNLPHQLYSSTINRNINL